MNRFPRASAATILVVAGLWLAMAHPPVGAQGAAPPQRELLLINEVQLKPDMTTQWAELQKSEMIPAMRKAGARLRDTWANGPGGDPYLRVMVTPIASLATFDGPGPLVRALGQEGAEALGAKNRKHIASARSTIVMTRPDLGFGTRPAAFKLGLLSIVNTANGRGADFEALLKSDVVPALKKGGVAYYAVAQVVFGDDVNKYLTLSAVNDYAELAKGSPLERSLGPEGMAKLTQKAAPLITRLERRIVRYLPDLSYGPSAPTSH